LVADRLEGIGDGDEIGTGAFVIWEDHIERHILA